MRVRAFTQDDAHIFCTEEQITEESLKVTNLILDIYKSFGFNDVKLKFSDRPEKRVGDDAIWDKSEKALLDAIKASGLKYEINKGEGAFYGPKIEFVLIDAIGRDWQCGTLQVDFNLPGRLGASYVANDGSKKIPVMLHRAMFGSLERFIGILIEHHAGKFPFWLSPEQVAVLPISSEQNDYAEKVKLLLEKKGLRSIIDLRNEKINYKIREHSVSKIPVLMICGGKEVQNNSITIRRLGEEKQETISLEKAITSLQAESITPTI
jgi:threonyl-tRNA synthetase